MNALLQAPRHFCPTTIKITGSKSETNRLLLLQALYPQIQLDNISDSDDSQLMIKALSTQQSHIDIHHAGTAMRFLTAYFATQAGRTVTITGSSRMQERPIKILVDALRQLGAEISYEATEGFPPLKIKGKKITQNKIALPANVSSQYISALLLIAPRLQNGLTINLEGEITSIPYIRMTLALLNELGIKTTFNNQTITVKYTSKIEYQCAITVESDWSSASYFFAITALSAPGTKICLSSYKPDSLQGDAALSEIYKSFGVKTTFYDGTLELLKTNHQPEALQLSLHNTPDIAQTIAVTCFGLGLGCHLTGLHTLKIKETDRLTALQTELSKLGATVAISENSLTLKPAVRILPNVRIATYNDHRMAMAFAPLAVKVPIIIEGSEVVSKSYPAFWNDLKKIGFQISEVL
ncbi:MAG: 3-phosphoshikimate 1-carboxyvinyltransferase [Burkholderiales bacterium]|nr:3-phosphoshikimate 1-carboxyvinyltransferase [Flavobacterium sp.]